MLNTYPPGFGISTGFYDSPEGFINMNHQIVQLEFKDKDYKEPLIHELKMNKGKENICTFVAKERRSNNE